MNPEPENRPAATDRGSVPSPRRARQEDSGPRHAWEQIGRAHV